MRSGVYQLTITLMCEVPVSMTSALVGLYGVVIDPSSSPVATMDIMRACMADPDKALMMVRARHHGQEERLSGMGDDSDLRMNPVIYKSKIPRSRPAPPSASCHAPTLTLKCADPVLHVAAAGKGKDTSSLKIVLENVSDRSRPFSLTVSWPFVTDIPEAGVLPAGSKLTVPVYCVLTAQRGSTRALRVDGSRWNVTSALGDSGGRSCSAVRQLALVQLREWMDSLSPTSSLDSPAIFGMMSVIDTSDMSVSSMRVVAVRSEPVAFFAGGGLERFCGSRSVSSSGSVEPAEPTVDEQGVQFLCICNNSPVLKVVRLSVGSGGRTSDSTGRLWGTSSARSVGALSAFRPVMVLSPFEQRVLPLSVTPVSSFSASCAQLWLEFASLRTQSGHKQQVIEQDAVCMADPVDDATLEYLFPSWGAERLSASLSCSVGSAARIGVEPAFLEFGSKHAGGELVAALPVRVHNRSERVLTVFMDLPAFVHVAQCSMILEPGAEVTVMFEADLSVGPSIAAYGTIAAEDDCHVVTCLLRSGTVSLVCNQVMPCGGVMLGRKPVVSVSHAYQQHQATGGHGMELPSVLDFGMLEVGEKQVRKLVLTNSGDCPILVRGVTTDIPEIEIQVLLGNFEDSLVSSVLMNPSEAFDGRFDDVVKDWDELLSAEVPDKDMGRDGEVLPVLLHPGVTITVICVIFSEVNVLIDGIVSVHTRNGTAGNGAASTCVLAEYRLSGFLTPRIVVSSTHLDFGSVDGAERGRMQLRLENPGPVSMPFEVVIRQPDVDTQNTVAMDRTKKLVKLWREKHDGGTRRQQIVFLPSEGFRGGGVDLHPAALSALRVSRRMGMDPSGGGRVLRTLRSGGTSQPFAVHPARGVLGPMSSDVLTVTYCPGIPGSLFQGVADICCGSLGDVSVSLAGESGFSLLALDRDVLDFGSIVAGTSKMMSIELHNDGVLAAPFEVLCPGTTFKVCRSSCEVEARSCIRLSVTFEPSHPTQSHNVLKLVFMHGRAPQELSVDLVGNCGVPAISIKTLSVDFDCALIGGSTTATIRVENSGNAEGSVSFSTLVPTITFVGGDSVSVAQGSGMNVQIRYTPLRVESFVTTIVANIPSQRSSVSIRVRCAVGAHYLVVHPRMAFEKVTFGTCLVGYSVQKSFEIVNSGNMDVNFRAYCVSTLSEDVTETIVQLTRRQRSLTDEGVRWSVDGHNVSVMLDNVAEAARHGAGLGAESRKQKDRQVRHLFNISPSSGVFGKNNGRVSFSVSYCPQSAQPAGTTHQCLVVIDCVNPIVGLATGTPGWPVIHVSPGTKSLPFGLCRVGGVATRSIVVDNRGTLTFSFTPRLVPLTNEERQNHFCPLISDSMIGDLQRVSDRQVGLSRLLKSIELLEVGDVAMKDRLEKLPDEGDVSEDAVQVSGTWEGKNPFNISEKRAYLRLLVMLVSQSLAVFAKARSRAQHLTELCDIEKVVAEHRPADALAQRPYLAQYLTRVANSEAARQLVWFLVHMRHAPDTIEPSRYATQAAMFSLKQKTYTVPPGGRVAFNVQFTAVELAAADARVVIDWECTGTFHSRSGENRAHARSPMHTTGGVESVVVYGESVMASLSVLDASLTPFSRIRPISGENVVGTTWESQRQTRVHSEFVEFVEERLALGIQRVWFRGLADDEAAPKVPGEGGDDPHERRHSIAVNPAERAHLSLARQRKKLICQLRLADVDGFLHFGMVAVHETHAQQLFISNGSMFSVSFFVAPDASSAFSVFPERGTIVPNGSIAVTVAFTPESAMTTVSELRVVWEGRPLRILVSGTGGTGRIELGGLHREYLTVMACAKSMLKDRGIYAQSLPGSVRSWCDRYLPTVDPARAELLFALGVGGVFCGEHSSLDSSAPSDGSDCRGVLCLSARPLTSMRVNQSHTARGGPGMSSESLYVQLAKKATLGLQGKLTSVGDLLVSGMDFGRVTTGSSSMRFVRISNSGEVPMRMRMSCSAQSFSFAMVGRARRIRAVQETDDSMLSAVASILGAPCSDAKSLSEPSLVQSHHDVLSPSASRVDSELPDLLRLQGDCLLFVMESVLPSSLRRLACGLSQMGCDLWLSGGLAGSEHASQAPGLPSPRKRLVSLLGFQELEQLTYQHDKVVSIPQASSVDVAIMLNAEWRGGYSGHFVLRSEFENHVVHMSGVGCEFHLTHCGSLQCGGAVHDHTYRRVVSLSCSSREPVDIDCTWELDRCWVVWREPVRSGAADSPAASSAELAVSRSLVRGCPYYRVYSMDTVPPEYDPRNRAEVLWGSGHFASDGESTEGLMPGTVFAAISTALGHGGADEQVGVLMDDATLPLFILVPDWEPAKTSGFDCPHVSVRQQASTVRDSAPCRLLVSFRFFHTGVVSGHLVVTQRVQGARPYRIPFSCDVVPLRVHCTDMSTIEFGCLPIGETDTVLRTFCNEGELPLDFTFKTTYAGLRCSVTEGRLEPGASIHVGISFTAVDAEQREMTVLMITSETVKVTARGRGGYSCLVLPPRGRLDFSRCLLAQETVRPLRLLNSGNARLRVDSLELVVSSSGEGDSIFYPVGDWPEGSFCINGYESVSLDVGFRPVVDRHTESASLIVHSSEGRQSIGLCGSGRRAVLVLSPEEGLDFEDAVVGVEASEAVVHIHDARYTSPFWVTLRWSCEVDGLSICPNRIEVPVNGSAPVKVRYCPTTPCDVTRVHIIAMAEFGECELPVVVSAGEPILDISVDYVKFGTFEWSERGIQRIFKLINRGTTSTNVSVENYDDFSGVVSLSCGSGCSIRVGEAVTVVAEWVGSAPRELGFDIRLAYATGYIFLPVHGFAGVRKLDVTDVSAIDFGCMRVRSCCSFTRVIRNVGNLPASFSFDTSYPVVVAPASAVVDPGQEMEVTFTWHPLGACTIGLSVRCSLSSGGSVFVSLTGLSCYPDLSVVPASLRCGVGSVGRSVPHTLHLTNESDLECEWSILRAPSFLTVLVKNGRLERRDSTTVSVEFCPTSKGRHRGVVVIGFGMELHTIEIPVSGVGGEVILSTELVCPCEFTGLRLHTRVARAAHGRKGEWKSSSESRSRLHGFHSMGWGSDLRSRESGSFVLTMARYDDSRGCLVDSITRVPASTTDIHPSSLPTSPAEGFIMCPSQSCTSLVTVPLRIKNLGTVAASVAVTAIQWGYDIDKGLSARIAPWSRTAQADGRHHVLGLSRGRSPMYLVGQNVVAPGTRGSAGERRGSDGSSNGSRSGSRRSYSSRTFSMVSRPRSAAQSASSMSGAMDPGDFRLVGPRRGELYCPVTTPYEDPGRPLARRIVDGAESEISRGRGFSVISRGSGGLSFSRAGRVLAEGLGSTQKPWSSRESTRLVAARLRRDAVDRMTMSRTVRSTDVVVQTSSGPVVVARRGKGRSSRGPQYGRIRNTSGAGVQQLRAGGSDGMDATGESRSAKLREDNAVNSLRGLTEALLCRQSADVLGPDGVPGRDDRGMSLSELLPLVSAPLDVAVSGGMDDTTWSAMSTMSTGVVHVPPPISGSPVTLLPGESLMASIQITVLAPTTTPLDIPVVVRSDEAFSVIIIRIPCVTESRMLQMTALRLIELPRTILLPRHPLLGAWAVAVKRCMLLCMIGSFTRRAFFGEKNASSAVVRGDWSDEKRADEKVQLDEMGDGALVYSPWEATPDALGRGLGLDDAVLLGDLLRPIGRSVCAPGEVGRLYVGLDDVASPVLLQDSNHELSRRMSVLSSHRAPGFVERALGSSVTSGGGEDSPEGLSATALAVYLDVSMSPLRELCAMSSPVTADEELVKGLLDPPGPYGEVHDNATALVDASGAGPTPVRTGDIGYDPGVGLRQLVEKFSERERYHEAVTGQEVSFQAAAAETGRGGPPSVGGLLARSTMIDRMMFSDVSSSSSGGSDSSFSSDGEDLSSPAVLSLNNPRRVRPAQPRVPWAKRSLVGTGGRWRGGLHTWEGPRSRAQGSMVVGNLRTMAVPSSSSGSE